jgi:orotidine-5'-phosphate decarboxylase
VAGLIANPLLVALDMSSAEAAVRTASDLVDVVGGFKVGMELLAGAGPGTIALVGDLGSPVFVDVKLHDIPTTVRRAARNLGAMGARWVSVHASGGEAMLSAAVTGLAEGAAGRPAGVLAVTVLTSLDDEALAEVGFRAGTAAQTVRLARLAEAAGCEGIVLSPRELVVAADGAPSLLKVTPGIRPAGVATDDQRRYTSPADAIRHGADLLVVGRPVTKSSDPRAAAAAIVAECATVPRAGRAAVGRVAALGKEGKGDATS